MTYHEFVNLKKGDYVTDKRGKRWKVYDVEIGEKVVIGMASPTVIITKNDSYWIEGECL